MTPKEKAKALYDIFEFPDGVHQISTFSRKQCALICVDEILNAIDKYNNSIGVGIGTGYQLKLEKYWKEVKEEINKS